VNNSLHLELERADEELHVLSLNYHASKATTWIQHNGVLCELGHIQQAHKASFLEMELKSVYSQKSTAALI